jgi:zinc/manganese transport system substrate-binding protein
MDQDMRHQNMRPQNLSRRTLFAAALTALSGTAGSRRGWAAAMPGQGPAGKIPVVATFSILGDLVATVGTDHVAVRTLVGPDQDVHVYEPKPRDLKDVRDAALVVENGLGLEGWMARLVGAAGGKGQVIEAGFKVRPRTMREGGAVATDPHAWQDPRNAVLYVMAIAEALVSADQRNVAAYQAAAEAFTAAIQKEDAAIEAAFAPIPQAQRRIITTHDAFGYYGARYGIEFLAAEGISTESEPSAKQIAALIQQIKAEKVHAVFIENMTSDRMAKMLARETGAALGGTVYSDALSPPNGPAANYLAMLRHNTGLFVKAMTV